MARFLIDTNTISEPTRKKPDLHVVELLKEHEADIAISSTILHELLFGIERLPRSQKRQQIRLYVDRYVIHVLPILPYDEDAAQWHASERVRLTAIGKTPAYADGQIAAVAAVHGLTLVTRNVSDFGAFQGLSVVNWHD